MIRVSVLYPHAPDARFDHVYYRDTHLPWLLEKLGPVVRACSVDEGLAGAAPGSPPPFVAICHLTVDSAETFMAAFGPHAKDVARDLPQYTDLQPVMQFSQTTLQREA